MTKRCAVQAPAINLNKLSLNKAHFLVYKRDFMIMGHF